MKIKTFRHDIMNIEERDIDINTFENKMDESGFDVKATQTNNTMKYIITTVFYQKRTR